VRISSSVFREDSEVRSGGHIDMAQLVGIWSLIFVTTLMLLATGCAQKTTPASTTQMSASGPSAEEIRAREE